MKFAIAFITLVCSLSQTIGAVWSSSEAQSMNLNAEPLRIVLSKIAPLEQWDVSWPNFGPRVCWRLFRPNPKYIDRLLHVINSFQGHTQWHVVDNCLVPGLGVTMLPAKSTPSSAFATMQLSEADANNDLTTLASEIEKRLDLFSIEPTTFSEELLTKEGLRKFLGPFEDFEDGGQRLTYVIVEPGPSEVFEATKADRMLHFGPLDDEIAAIFSGVLGADLTVGHGRALTDAETEKIQQGFPILWKISDYYEDAYLSPQEAAGLLQECVALDRIVSSPKAIRGLDKLFRIARWASEKHYGVLFSAP